MVDYNSLKTEEERQFVILHGAENCYFKKLGSAEDIIDFLDLYSSFYIDENGFINEEYIKVAKKYGGKNVLIARKFYYLETEAVNHICGDDYMCDFIDDMFVDSKF